MWTVELAVIAVMIGFNSILAGFEIALASVGLGRLQALVEQRRSGAAAAMRMKQRMEASLAVVQLGINLVGATAAATGGAGAEETLEPLFRQWGLSPTAAQFLAIGVIVAPLTAITIVFGELVPKVFALRNKEWLCLKLSPAMEWFSISVWPAVWVLEHSVSIIMKLAEVIWPQRDASGRDATIQELHGAAAQARMSRLIGRREEGIIVSASRLANTPLQRIMLPAEFIGMLYADQSLADALVNAHQGMHTRYPVTEKEGDPQRIIGYVNFKDIVVALRLSPREPSLRGLIRQLASFPEQLSVATCLETMMRERNHIALVRGASGQVVGMVTLEDIVEELVGEIHDEFDRMPAHLIPAGKGWIAGGFVSLVQLRQRTGIDLQPPSEKPIYNLNDWIAEHLEHPPRGGDEIRTENYRIIVRKTRNILVQEAYVEQSRDHTAPASEPPV